MMSPDPSTMTSEAIPFAEGYPWDDPWVAAEAPGQGEEGRPGPAPRAEFLRHDRDVVTTWTQTSSIC